MTHRGKNWWQNKPPKIYATSHEAETVRYIKFFTASSFWIAVFSSALFFFSPLGFLFALPIGLLLWAALVIPSMLLGVLPWILMRGLFKKLGLGYKISAIVSSVPTMWLGVQIPLFRLGVYKAKTSDSGEEWNSIVLTILMSLALIISPIVAGKTYSEEPNYVS